MLRGFIKCVWRVPKLVLFPLLVSGCAASSVLLARAYVRRKAKSFILIYLEERAYRILSTLMVASCSSRSGDLSVMERSMYVCVTLNWDNGHVKHVPVSVFEDEKLNLMSLFDIYCGLSGNRYPDVELVCDLWNCVMSLLEYKLLHYVSTGTIFSLDSEELNEVFVVGSLLHTRYSWCSFAKTLGKDWPSYKERLVLHDFPEELFERFLEAYKKEQSFWRSFVSFVRVFSDSCSIQRFIALIAVLLLSPEPFLEAALGLNFGVNWSSLYVLEMEKLVTNDVLITPSPWEFIRQQYQGAPGTLAAIAVASSGAMEVLYCLREYITNLLCIDFSSSLYLNTYLDLATYDYCADEDWFLTRCVSHSLWNASQSFLGELQGCLPHFLALVESSLMTIRYPIMALAMWVGNQWSDYVEALTESFYLEVQYAKSLFPLSSLSNEETSLNNLVSGRSFPPHPSPISLISRGGMSFTTEDLNPDADVVGDVGLGILSFFSFPCDEFHNEAPHYGLALLTTLCMDAKFDVNEVWCSIFRHVSWPANPSVIVRHLLSSMDRSVTRGTSLRRVQNFEWVRTILRKVIKQAIIVPHVDRNTRYRRAYVKAFTSLRRAGVELTASRAAVNEAYARKNNERSTNYGRELLQGLFTTADDSPLLFASTAAVYFAPGYLELNALEQGYVMSNLQHIQYLYPLFPSLDGLFYTEENISPPRLEALNAQHGLRMSGSSINCYRVLDALHSYQERIDRPLNDPPPSMEGPWSLEFRDVSFRYKQGGPCILNNVSFSIASGEFIGIIGYSGCGKTTIMRLINRIYTPTSGDIFINGHNIKCYPVRKLRRRIANAWQEENDMRFFENLTVANNLILGNLSMCEEENIHNALKSAQALSFVKSRSSGIHCPLNTQEFSGGEVERLCIARALMRRGTVANLYLLDEATSAVDAITESKIFKEIGINEKGSPRESTFMVVSHRLATLKNADRIIVLNDGKVEQVGNWKQLCEDKSSSCFLDMLRSQQLPRF